MSIKEHTVSSGREPASGKGSAGRVTVIEGRRPGILAALGELWRYRRYLMFFGRTILARRYARTWLGLLWLPLRPVLNVGTRLLVFGGLVVITAGNIPSAVVSILA
jgi:ABC-type polysaccharide/polyol phosphate export permease